MAKKEKSIYQETMNLPKTGFPMRAGLSKSEPKRLADWNENHLYEQLQKKWNKSGNGKAETK